MDELFGTKERIFKVYILLEFSGNLYVDCQVFSNLKKSVEYIHDKQLSDYSYATIQRRINENGYFDMILKTVNYRLVVKQIK